MVHTPENPHKEEITPKSIIAPQDIPNRLAELEEKISYARRSLSGDTYEDADLLIAIADARMRRIGHIIEHEVGY